MWIVLLLTLSGACGGDNPTSAAPANDAHTTAKPDSQPPAPTSATPPTGPSDSAVPVMPEWGNHNSKDGAITFVRHYVDLLNYAQATGGVDELTRSSKADCQSCNNFIERVGNIYSANGQIRGGRLHITTLFLIEADREPGKWRVLVELTHGKQVIREDSDAKAKKHPRDRSFVTFIPEKRNDGWKMSRWFITG